jgi:succinyl-diaminopimelate desuccinylase
VEKLLQLTKKLIEIPSITPDGLGCLLHISKHLKALGFDVYILRFDDVFNLYARFGDQNLPNLCFAGHVDVVPAKKEDGWQFDPFECKIVDEKIIGRGICDMKASIACFMQACSDFLSQEPKLNFSVSFLLTSDEEGKAINGTKKVIDWLKDKKEAIDFCLIGEPTCESILGDFIKIGRRGSLNVELKISGESGHVAYPNKSSSPNQISLKFLDYLQNICLDSGYENFQPSNLEITKVESVSSAVNVLPSDFIARFNIRFNPNHTFESLENYLQKKFYEMNKDKKISAQWHFERSAEPYYVGVTEQAILLRDAIKKKTNVDAKFSTSGGTSDGRFINQLCPVAEFGLPNTTAHQVNENIKVLDLQLLHAIYLEFLLYYNNFMQR